MSDAMNTSTQTPLAIHGGAPIRSAPWPARRLFGDAEKQAVITLFDEAIAAGEAFGYAGRYEDDYCAAFVSLMGGGFADGVNSGTSALYVALRALELPAGAEVVVPAITDPGGVMPVALCGCTPVPADTTPMSYNVGAEQIKAVLSKRTAAIVVAHIAGYPCDMRPIVDLARAHHLPLIEDCSQAHGATYAGRPVGTFGDMACFSTMFAKHHATGGQGGVVYTRNESLYWRARRAADRGKPMGLKGKSENVVASLNLNMDEMHAAVGCAQIKRLFEIVERRRQLVSVLAGRCRQGVRTVRAVETFNNAAESESSHLFLFFRFDAARAGVDKATLVQAAMAEGIPFEVGYLPLPCRQPWYTEQFGRDWPLPNAHGVDAAHFNLRLHEGCGDKEVEDVVRTLAKVESKLAR